MELPKLAELWNKLAHPSLARVRGCGSTRKRLAERRWKENQEAYWSEVILRMNDSPFCRGETGGTWIANFDWLIRPDTQFKILEGKYDNKTTPPSPKKDPRYVAEKIWEAAANTSLRPRIKSYDPAWRALKETYGSWEALGQQREQDGPFVVNRLVKKLKELGFG